MQHISIRDIALTLLDRKPISSLAPDEVWREDLDQSIQSWSPGDNCTEIRCVKSALLLLNSNLDASHTLSQSIHSSTGSYLHGIMHRMEPDYPNAKYWFRQTGSHPLYPRLWQEIKAWAAQDASVLHTGHAQLNKWLEADEYDPFIYVDLVELALASKSDELIVQLEQIQHLELRLLLNYVYDQYSGGPLFEHE